ncbi:uncharacterized protein PITG_14951 [Phytophthora infestans T30-4]|uniref:Uncharacterized protein n=1 Tax=Phytophthora infestans (strain T30-4) TaxID=403677 RepID=D0NPE3_PHYIT|nr:uncharacterized protein PITG_14951 [Phytophthora infestans T30-4]EEY62485.1 conserved hypothetical protein [Phytophthora infestans T30-4]|eukprot:XP_002899121.1 conserved hypothetical protein [Phytophthora infestans T30-4]
MKSMWYAEESTDETLLAYSSGTEKAGLKSNADPSAMYGSNLTAEAPVAYLAITEPSLDVDPGAYTITCITQTSAGDNDVIYFLPPVEGGGLNTIFCFVPSLVTFNAYMLLVDVGTALTKSGAVQHPALPSVRAVTSTEQRGGSDRKFDRLRSYLVVEERIRVSEGGLIELWFSGNSWQGEYESQQPFSQNETMCTNITFELPCDADKYEEALRVSSLKTYLDCWRPGQPCGLKACFKKSLKGKLVLLVAHSLSFSANKLLLSSILADITFPTIAFADLISNDADESSFIKLKFILPRCLYQFQFAKLKKFTALAVPRIRNVDPIINYLIRLKDTGLVSEVSVLLRGTRMGHVERVQCESKKHQRLLTARPSLIHHWD